MTGLARWALLAGVPVLLVQGRSVAAVRPRVRHLPLAAVVDATSFAADGFHPSAYSHAVLAAQVLAVSEPRSGR